jgi:hypothetical protein
MATLKDNRQLSSSTGFYSSARAPVDIDERSRPVLRTRTPSGLALLLGDPTNDVVGEDELLGGMGIDCAGKHDQPFVQFRTGEDFGFGFSLKHSAFAGAALFLMQQAAFANLKSDIPDRHRDPKISEQCKRCGTGLWPGTLIYIKRSPRKDMEQ